MRSSGIASDDDLYAWLLANVPIENIRRANRWLLDERQENLDRQDAEEGATAQRVYGAHDRVRASRREDGARLS